MAGPLQSVFMKSIQTVKNPDSVERLKSAVGHAGLYVGLIVYTAIGAKIFQAIEHPLEIEKLDTFRALLVTKRELFLQTLWNSSLNINSATYKEELDSALSSYEAVASDAVGAGLNLVDKDFTYNWDYVQSVFFALTILTTIGYGNFAAESFAGRLFCLLFAIIGIPFTLSVLADIGQIFADVMSSIWKSNKSRIQAVAKKLHIIPDKTKDKDKETEDGGDLLGFDEFSDDDSSSGFASNLWTALGGFLFLTIFMLSGAVFFYIWEPDWTLFDSFYFCFVTMTTIGFGDMTPSISGSEKSMYMLFSTVYILVGLAFTSTIIELVRRQYAESWRKMQELRAQIQAQMKLAETLKKLTENAEKNNLDLGVNIASDLEGLKNNLNKFKNSKMGKEFDDIDIKELDWVEDDKKIKAFFIYESSL